MAVVLINCYNWLISQEEIFPESTLILCSKILTIFWMTSLSLNLVISILFCKILLFLLIRILSLWKIITHNYKLLLIILRFSKISLLNSPPKMILIKIFCNKNSLFIFSWKFSIIFWIKNFWELLLSSYHFLMILIKFNNKLILN